MAIFDLAAGFVAYSILLFMFLFVCYAWAMVLTYAYRFISERIVWPRKIVKKEKGWKWHWLPYCVCSTVGDSRLIKGKNFLWLNWLFCFNRGG